MLTVRELVDGLDVRLLTGTPGYASGRSRQWGSSGAGDIPIAR